MAVTGQTRMNARPMTSDSGMAPKNRLSRELGRLSPITQRCSGGTVTFSSGPVVTSGPR